MFVLLLLLLLNPSPPDYLHPVLNPSPGWTIPDLAHGTVRCEPWHGFTLCTSDEGARYVDGQPAYL